MHSRNPNLCASCSSFIDGMGEDFPEPESPVPGEPPTSGLNEHLPDAHKCIHD
jgi:hypothetical protein